MIDIRDVSKSGVVNWIGIGDIAACGSWCRAWKDTHERADSGM